MDKAVTVTASIEASSTNVYWLHISGDGDFTHRNVIAHISSNTTDEERVQIANHHTNGAYSKTPGFYKITGPYETVPHYTIKKH